MDASFKLTRQEILAVYDSGRAAIVALIGDLIERFTSISEQQQQRITALEQELQELKKDSHDSGKPPSRDSFERKQQSRKSSRRERTGKRPGGQPKHRGASLRQVEHPDIVTLHAVGACRCGRVLVDEPVADYERRQVFDLPPLVMQVTEHRAERKRCPDCGEVLRATFPEGVTQPVQYGERLSAVAAYLRNYGLLPYERTAELFEDLFSVPISVGTLVGLNASCGHRLEGINELLRKHLIGAPVVCFDETGMSIEGKLNWLHVASTERVTCYGAHAKRGREAFEAIAILPHYRGVAVHDHWHSYFLYECLHGLCNAHHLRELTFIEEQYEQPWATELKELLMLIKGAVERAQEAGLECLDRAQCEHFAAAYRRIMEAGLGANPPPPEAAGGGKKKRGRKKQSKPRNLLLRLASRERQVLAFMYDFRVPFTNNLAERDLRMMKVQQKISGTFRSRDGADAFCRTRSYISTIRKNGLSVIDALRSVFAGQPMIPPPLKATAE